MQCIHKSGECHQYDMQIDNNTNVKNHNKRIILRESGNDNSFKETPTKLLRRFQEQMTKCSNSRLKTSSLCSIRLGSENKDF